MIPWVLLLPPMAQPDAWLLPYQIAGWAMRSPFWKPFWKTDPGGMESIHDGVSLTSCRNSMDMLKARGSIRLRWLSCIQLSAGNRFGRGRVREQPANRSPRFGAQYCWNLRDLTSKMSLRKFPFKPHQWRTHIVAQRS